MCQLVKWLRLVIFCSIFPNLRCTSCLFWQNKTRDITWSSWKLLLHFIYIYLAHFIDDTHDQRNPFITLNESIHIYLTPEDKVKLFQVKWQMKWFTVFNQGLHCVIASAHSNHCWPICYCSVTLPLWGASGTTPSLCVSFVLAKRIHGPPVAPSVGMQKLTCGWNKLESLLLFTELIFT